MLSLPFLAAAALSAFAQAYGTPAPAPPAVQPGPETPAVSAAPATPVSPPGRALKDLPGISIRYYDVRGKKIKEVINSLTAQRPKDAQGQPVTAAINWTVNTEFSKRTAGANVCTVAGAKATLVATAELPRLADAQSFDKREFPNWQAYSAGLETAAAAKLWFVHDNLGTVEKAILASGCDAAEAAGEAAVKRLREQSSAVRATAPAADAVQGQ